MLGTLGVFPSQESRLHTFLSFKNHSFYEKDENSNPGNAT